MAVARGGTGVKRTIVMEHFWGDVEIGRRQEKRGNNCLGPTPEKSSLSMTSACIEPVCCLAGLARPLDRDLALWGAESEERERTAGGAGREGMALGMRGELGKEGEREKR